MLKKAQTKLFGIAFFSLSYLITSCGHNDGAFMDTKLEIPPIFKPNHWNVINNYESDSTFAMKDADSTNSRFVDTIVIYKSGIYKTAKEAAQRSMEDIKRRYSIFKMGDVNPLKSSISGGMIADCTFQDGTGRTIGSTIYTGKFANTKNIFVISFKSLNELGSNYSEKRKLFLSLLNSSFQLKP